MSQRCPSCDGTGTARYGGQCSNCHGLGRLNSRTRFIDGVMTALNAHIQERVAEMTADHESCGRSHRTEADLAKALAELLDTAPEKET